MRVMIIEGDAEGGDIYANPEASEEGENWLKQHTSYETIAFISEKQLMAKRVTDFSARRQSEIHDRHLGGRLGYGLHRRAAARPY